MSLIPGWIRGLNLYTLVLALVTGGIVHISVTLALPHLARANAFLRLSEVVGINSMQVLPPASAAAQPLPYLGPDVRLAVCRFDVTDGPVTVSLALPESGWTLGLYTMQGDNFYVLPAQEQRSQAISLTLVMQGERSFSLLSLGRPAAIRSISQIEVPQAQGFAVIRAPLRGRAFAAETDAILHRARCGRKSG